eukprot:m.88596 g.88596  ORF g.88596 m.88596 type:complete len:102 (+) comp36582_c0_seq7:2038-2343(+)
MDWIERLIFQSGRLTVSGFRSTDFVVWTVDSNETLLSWNCGGAHRSWDMNLDLDEGLVSFSYLKNQKLNFVRRKIWREMPSTVLQVHHSVIHLIARQDNAS